MASRVRFELTITCFRDRSLTAWRPRNISFLIFYNNYIIFFKLFQIFGFGGGGRTHINRVKVYGTTVILPRINCSSFRAVNQALQILFSPKLHIAGMTITHSPLALWTLGFTLCSYSPFDCLTHRGCLIFLSRIVPSAANLSCSSFRVVSTLENI